MKSCWVGTMTGRGAARAHSCISQQVFITAPPAEHRTRQLTSHPTAHPRDAPPGWHNG